MVDEKRRGASKVANPKAKKAIDVESAKQNSGSGFGGPTSGFEKTAPVAKYYYWEENRILGSRLLGTL